MTTTFIESPFPLVFAPTRPPVTQRSWAARYLPASALPWSLRRSLARPGAPIVLGTAARPFVAANGGETLFRRLLDRLETLPDSRAVHLVSHGVDLVGHVDRLAELDRRHAVSIDLPLPSLDPLRAHRCDPTAPAPGARLDALTRLSDRGLAVRVLIGAAGAGEATEVAAAVVHRGAVDLAVDARSAHLTEAIWRLRQRHGLPNGSMPTRA